MLKTLPHPWIIFEDCHINMHGILDLLNKFMIKGDYLFVEDLNPFTTAFIFNPLNFDIKNYKFFGS